MNAISFLIKPASSLCNMRCKYCFYHDVSAHRAIKSYGNMQEDCMEALILKALHIENCVSISFCFQGGEPTLAGLAFFQAFVSFVKKHKTSQRVQYAIQTNGMLMDDEWARFFYKHQFLVGISLDGYKENHDANRIYGQEKPTYAVVMHAIDIVKKHKVTYNIVTVLTKQLANHGAKLYAFYKKQGFTYIQFIPCLSDFAKDQTNYALEPKQFALFYKQFFHVWYKDNQYYQHMHIGLFDNIIPMFLGIRPQQCGMLGRCAFQFVVESKGDVFPCDFYVLDTYRCGNILTDTLESMLAHPNAKQFLSEQRNGCKECITCPFLHMCHGNCKRLKDAYYNDEYCGYRDFLFSTYQEMKGLAMQLMLRKNL